MPRLGKKTRAGRIAPAAKNRTLHSRPPLYRFQEIFHAIKTGRYPNRTKLAKTIEVTTKTIQRDIDYMRYQFDLPIEFDFARGGYYFTKPMTELPLFQLTEAELVSVFVAQKALEAYKGTAFEQPLRTAFQKLQAATGSANVSVSWEDFDSAISFRHFGAYLPDATIFSELATAIRNEEVVEFGYKKLDAKAYEKRTVEPWHLACVSGQWYLLGHGPDSQGMPDLRARPDAKGLGNWPEVFEPKARRRGSSTSVPKQFSDLAKLKHWPRANRSSILRPGRAARSRTQLAFQPADPGVGRR